MKSCDLTGQRIETIQSLRTKGGEGAEEVGTGTREEMVTW